MSGDGPDVEASAAALALIAQGINKAQGELEDLGMVGMAQAGRGFSDLALSGLELGHEGLAAEFGSFCERWEWGVRALMERGNEFAAGVGLSAGAIHEQDEYVKDTIKVAVNGVNGNPWASEDEVKAKSWEQISRQSAFDGADWSGDSFAKAQGEVNQTWQDTAYNVEDAAMDSADLDPAVREVLDADMRDRFDPSDEAIKEAQQPNWGDR
jgi:hypothetical protein